MHTLIQRQRKQDGFTLLEVLIALLVLSIGLLGLASLQTVGLRSNQMATIRTLATQRAYDMSDRMRANQSGVDAQNYVQTVTAVVPTGTIVNCATTVCTPVQMATFDVAAWMTEVIRLPGGRGRITRDASGTLVTHTITIFWDEERRGVTGTNCGADPKVDLRCIQLTL
ncbi:MAG: type IV pilus modification protein PilV [Gammaproteobacteria bacterium]|nr:type IV pilus modification protein PilV [Gammaproteobacteria bacterium]